MQSRGVLFIVLTCVFGVAMPVFLGGAPTSAPVAVAQAQGREPARPANRPDSGAAEAGGAAVRTAAAGAARDGGAPVVAQDDVPPKEWLDRNQRCESLLVEPITTLIGATPPSEPAEAGAPEQHAPAFVAAARSLLSLPPGAVDFVVATVPDPARSGMYYTSDRVIEALQRGVEAQGDEAPSATSPLWLRDRFWSPWGEEAAADDTDRKKLLRDCRERMPGIITFRNDPAFDLRTRNKQILLLFLVGESPISGVNKTALKEALDFIDGASPSLPEVRIVGPTFSGSAASLRVELSEWLKKRPPPASPAPVPPPRAGAKKAAPRVAAAEPVVPCFTIVSGTTTNDRLKSRLDTCKTDKLDLSCTSACSAPHAVDPAVTFHATTVPDTQRLKAFYKTLQSRFGVKRLAEPGKCRLERVALLKETSTAYSDIPPSTADAGATPPVPAPEQTDDEPSGSQDTGHPSGTDCEPELMIPFPPHISSVRHAYDAEKKAAAQSAPVDVTLLPALPISLDEPSEPRDLLGDLSPRTVSSNDLLIGNIIDTMMHRDVRYVGIFATDRSDVIFLAHQLHKHAADVRIFTVASELLYAHPSYGAALDGMLVVSTYPLLLDHGSKEARIELFSGEQEEGVFNATVALLGKRSSLREYGGAAPNDRPPVWVSVIGRGGAYPLEMTEGYEDKNFVLHAGGVPAPSPEVAHDASRDVRPAHFWRLASFIVSLLLACVGLTYLASMIGVVRRALRAKAGGVTRALVRPDDARPSKVPLSSLFHPCESDDLAVRKEACVVLLFAMFLAAYAPISALLRIIVQVEAAPWVASFVLSLLGTCSVVSCAYLVLTAVVRHRDTKLGAVAVVSALAALAGAAIAGWTAFHVGVVAERHCVTTHDCYPILARAVALDSGISPVAPMLLALLIGVVWVVSTIDRLRLVDDLCSGNADVLPIASALAIQKDAGAPKDILTLERDLVATLKRPSRELLARLAALPILAIPLYAFLYIKPVSTLEYHGPPGTHPLWMPADRIAALVTVTCGVLVVDAAVSFLLVFFRLRALLRRLAHHPLVDAYKRLPSALARSLEQQLSGSIPDLNDLAVAVFQLRIAANNPAGVSAEGFDATEMKNAADAVHVAFDTERAKFADGDRSVALARSNTATKLLAAAALVLPALRTWWSKRGGLDEPAMPSIVPSGGGEPAPPKPEAPTPAQKLGQQQEDFISSLVAIFLPHYVAPLRSLMTVAIGGAVLLLLLIASYPFQPSHLLMSFLWVLIVSSAVIVAWVFIQLDRDEVLSRIGKSTPGSINFNRDFVFRILAWAALPILSLFAVQYPAIGDALFSWLKPLVTALR